MLSVKQRLYNTFLQSLDKVKIFDLLINNKSNLKNKAILLYHGTTKKSFLDHINFLRKKKFEFVTLDTLLDSLNIINNKKQIVISFDDFDISFYTDIFSLIEKYEIPTINYLVSSIVTDENYFFWWERLNKIRNKKENFNSDTLLNLTYVEREKILKKLSDHYPNFEKEKMLTKPMILEMDKNDLVTIGSHSVHHPNFLIESEDVINDELTRSKLILEDFLKHKVVHFAYPTGLYREKHKILVQQAGYKSAVAVNNKWIKNSDSWFSIPRINTGPPDSSVSWLKYRLSIVK